MPAPHALPITVGEADRLTLQGWARRPKTAQALALRARIVLAAATGEETNLEIAERLRTNRHTVAKWRGRYAKRGLAGLTDEPRPGAPRTITDDHVDAVLAATLEQAPPSGTHWSTRQLAQRLGLSQTAVSRIWRAFGLAPHRAETFKLSRDPPFVETGRDVVGLYLAPPERALVLCVDEKTPVQAREPTAPVVPTQPGQLERRTHDYVRHGTTDLFAALDVASGRVIAETHRRHRSVEFRRFLDTVDAAVPPDLDVHLVLDDAATHKTALIRRWLLKRPRYHAHSTPTSSSWLNLVECWFSILQRRELARGVYRSTYALERAIRQYVAAADTEAKPFVWTKTADEILASVARFRLRTSNSDHQCRDPLVGCIRLAGGSGAQPGGPMLTGRPRQFELTLTETERRALTATAHSRTLPYSHVRRAQIILRSAAGGSNTSIARAFGLAVQTVGHCAGASTRTV